MPAEPDIPDPRRAAAGRRRLPAAVAFVAGLLWAAAVPPLEWSALAWFAPALWLAVCMGAAPRAALGRSLLTGAAFWLPSLAWLTHVTWLGWFILAVYCALYLLPLGLGAALWSRRIGCRTPGRALAFAVWAAALWCGLEYARGVCLTGFPWHPLAATQTRRLLLLQNAEWGGVAAVSFPVAFFNAALAAGFARARATSARAVARRPAELLAAALLLAGLTASGARLWMRVPEPDATVRLALVQPAIPQNVKWTDEFVQETYRRLESLTRRTFRDKPDLVIWPETAVADDLRENPAAYDFVLRLAEEGPPLLVGTLTSTRNDDGLLEFFNASCLIRHPFGITQEYDKRHLVLFGEYVPFTDRFPWLRNFTPVPYDVAPGREPVVFRLPGRDLPFAALICFEDTLAYLARDCARRGARLLVNQTNDAWFDYSSGSRQHLLHGLIRCVETRLPAVRACNTGVTCWIDPRGRIGGAGGEASGSLPRYRPGPSLRPDALVADVPWRAADAPPTFYVRHGDLFAQGLMGIGVAGLLILGWPRRSA